jgi:hypothetical protein
MALCLILLAGNCWGEDRTASKAEVAATQPTTQPTTKPVERSMTVEGITLTVSVPPRVQLDTPIPIRLRNDSDRTVTYKATDEPAFFWCPTLRDASGTLVRTRWGEGGMGFFPSGVTSRSLIPTEERTHKLHLKVTYPELRPGHYTMTIQIMVGVEPGRGVLLTLEDVPVEVVEK